MLIGGITSSTYPSMDSFTFIPPTPLDDAPSSKRKKINSYFVPHTTYSSQPTIYNQWSEQYNDATF